VLLVACVNVATLLLARSSARRRELAVRVAIGASPRRIVRQLLTESLLLAFFGGAAGLLIATWATQLLGRFMLGRTGIQRLDTSLDLRVLAFTAIACLLTGILFGLAPAVQALRVELTATLKDAERGSAAGGRWSASRILIAAQMAIAVLVIFAAGLLVRTLVKLRTADLGYPRERLLIMFLDPVADGYQGARYTQLVRDLSDRLRNTPGVRAVTASENGLFSGSESADTIKVEGFTPQKDRDRVSYNDTVAPGYFTTVGIPLLLGRDISADDIASRPLVAVVNESFAKFCFGSQNPIGRRFYMDDSGKLSKPIEIIGVARDNRNQGMRQPIRRRFYRALFQQENFGGEMNFEIRTVAGEAAAMDSVRSAVRSVDPKLNILRLSSFNSLVDGSISDSIMLARLSMTFGILAVVLGVIGLYGVMSYGVAGRTREIGVRMALGARRSDVLWMVLREALTIATAGIVVGVPLALAASRALKTMLFEVAPFDPLPLAAAIVTLALVAAIGGAIPARRATLVDPMEALRYE
jgi:predicted permease